MNKSIMKIILSKNLEMILTQIEFEPRFKKRLKRKNTLKHNNFIKK